MYTIMIIEDDPKIAGLLKSHIERYGDRAVLVEDFEMIVQQFEQVQPHVVLLDINLPSYDGFYWCRQIRTLSTCPILFISARSGRWIRSWHWRTGRMIILRSHLSMRLL